MSDEEVRIVLHDDVQLVDWGESRAGGPWVKLRLTDPALLDAFRGMDTATLKRTGHVLSCTLAEGDIATLAGGADAPTDRDAGQIESGKVWQALIAAGVFRSPEVLRAIGPEREYEDWIRSQPSALDGAMDTVLSELDQCYKQRNQCCHVRRVSRGAGTGEKPPYFAVPMTLTQHRLQHDKGEAAVIEKYRHGFEFANAANDAAAVIAKDWFTKRADRYQKEWATMTLAEKLLPGFSSRSEVPAQALLDWFADNGLSNYLPSELREPR